MNKPEFKEPPLTDEDLEKVHVFRCGSCGASALYTDQEFKTALFPLDRVKCICGAVLTHYTSYNKKSWVDKNLRNK